jgi:hypothetical protein
VSSVSGEGPTFEEDPQGSEERRERIRLETPRHRIEGSLMLARDGYRSRVSDMLNASERDFLTLTDVTTSCTWSRPGQTAQSREISSAPVEYVVRELSQSHADQRASNHVARIVDTSVHPRVGHRGRQ